MIVCKITEVLIRELEKHSFNVLSTLGLDFMYEHSMNITFLEVVGERK